MAALRIFRGGRCSRADSWSSTDTPGTVVDGGHKTKAIKQTACTERGAGGTGPGSSPGARSIGIGSAARGECKRTGCMNSHREQLGDCMIELYASRLRVNAGGRTCLHLG